MITIIITILTQHYGPADNKNKIIIPERVLKSPKPMQSCLVSVEQVS
jgi:hypothetical protein